MTEQSREQDGSFMAPDIWPSLVKIGRRVQQYANVMPAAAFTTSGLWQKAGWTATTFQWHPESAAPPVMGIVCEHAESARQLFLEFIGMQGHRDALNELRISIIEGDIPGQPTGYTIHLYPDIESLQAYATAEDFVVDETVLPFLGQWNRSYPQGGNATLLTRFKEEYARHGQFMLCPVVRRDDGQYWAEPDFGIIKNKIAFRNLSELSPEDVDGGALVVPRLIRPR